MKIKRTKEDAACSELVRECFDWTCTSPTLVTNCLRAVDRTDPARARFHASHLIGRGHYATRWLPYNQICSCMYCHNHMENRKYLVEADARRFYGDDAVDFVYKLDREYSQVGSSMAMSRPFAKKSAWRDRIYQWLKDTHKDIHGRRMQGDVGFIDPGYGPFREIFNTFADSEERI